MFDLVWCKALYVDRYIDRALTQSSLLMEQVLKKTKRM